MMTLREHATTGQISKNQTKENADANTKHAKGPKIKKEDKLQLDNTQTGP